MEIFVLVLNAMTFVDSTPLTQLTYPRPRESAEIVQKHYILIFLNSLHSQSIFSANQLFSFFSSPSTRF